MRDIMIAAMSVLLAHLLYDLHLQGPFIAENKRKYFFYMVVHSATYALIVSLTLAGFKLFQSGEVALLFGSHFAIDSWKARLPESPKCLRSLYIDQTLHLVVLILVLIFN